jgi:hypothetical protein
MQAPSATPVTHSFFQSHRTEYVHGLPLTVVTHNDVEFLIGVQIAHHFHRETFNLYRSMKLSGIALTKCDPDQIEELARLDAIKRGIHSVTLVPLAHGLAYIGKELKRKPRKKAARQMRRFISDMIPGAAGSNSDEGSSDNFRQHSVVGSDESDELPDASATGSPREEVWSRLLLVASAKHMELVRRASQPVSPQKLLASSDPVNAPPPTTQSQQSSLFTDSPSLTALQA